MTGYNPEMSDINVVYIIPNEGWIRNISMASIYENSNTSKYDKFKIDTDPYNRAFRNLMSYIHNANMIGIDAVKEWLNRDD